jgi:hypothetical protein
MGLTPQFGHCIQLFICSKLFIFLQFFCVIQSLQEGEIPVGQATVLFNSVLSFSLSSFLTAETCDISVYKHSYYL